MFSKCVAIVLPRVKKKVFKKSQLRCSVHDFIVNVTENVDECYVAIDTTNEIR